MRKALTRDSDLLLCRRRGLQTFMDERICVALFGGFGAEVQNRETGLVLRLLVSMLSKQMGFLRCPETANAYNIRERMLTTR